MNTTSFEARIQRLEDIKAIKNLMGRYSFHINKGWNDYLGDVEAMPTIFAHNARWDTA